MAVGAVFVPQAYTGRTREEDRLALAVGAYRRGVFLLEVIDVPALGPEEAVRAWAPVWGLVERMVPDLVVVYSRDRLRVPAAPNRDWRVPVRVLGPGG